MGVGMMWGWLLLWYSVGLAAMIVVSVWRRVLCRIQKEKHEDVIV